MVSFFPFSDFNIQWIATLYQINLFNHNRLFTHLRLCHGSFIEISLWIKQFVSTLDNIAISSIMDTVDSNNSGLHVSLTLIDEFFHEWVLSNHKECNEFLGPKDFSWCNILTIQIEHALLAILNRSLIFVAFFTFIRSHLVAITVLKIIDSSNLLRILLISGKEVRTLLFNATYYAL